MPITRANPTTADRGRAMIEAPADPGPSGAVHPRPGATTIVVDPLAGTVPVAVAVHAPVETARARAVPTRAVAHTPASAMTRVHLAKRHARRPRR